MSGNSFLEDGHLESPGIASSWGGPNLYENDFIVNPYGPGWHLDRRRFDLMLAHAAQASGVEVLRGSVRLPSAISQPHFGRASLLASRSPIQLGRSLALPSPKAGIDFMPYPPAGWWGPLSTGNKSSTGRPYWSTPPAGRHRSHPDSAVVESCTTGSSPSLGYFKNDRRRLPAISAPSSRPSSADGGIRHHCPADCESPHFLRMRTWCQWAGVGASGCGTNRSSRHLT